MNIKTSDVFKYIEERDLITLAQLYPQQLLDMCILLSLDYQLEEENKPNYIN
jgi:hypothetical protein